MPASVLEKETVDCLVCGSPQAETVLERYDGEVKDWIRLVRCLECGLVYMNPRPTRQAMGHYYPDSYYSFHKLEAFFGAEKCGLFERVKLELIRRMARCYFAEGKAFHERLYRALVLAFFDNVAGGTGLPQMVRRGRLLDVGCGDGYLIYHLRELGWEVYGVEPSPVAVGVAQKYGLKVQRGDLLSVALPGDYFDVVRMMGVVEHLHDPRQDLQEAYRILRRGGELVIGGAPHLGTFWAKLFGRRVNLLYETQHTFMPMAGHIERLLTEVGFEDIRISFPCCHMGSQSLRRVLGSGKLGTLVAYNPLVFLMGTAVDFCLRRSGQGGGGLEVRAIKAPMPVGGEGGS